MKIKNLYEKCDIMPQLSTHQLRVAGVGKIVAENWITPCDVNYVTKLCLIHDLGNIVKFDLTDTTKRSLFGPIPNPHHWLTVQQQYKGRYGHDAHAATIALLRENRLEAYVPNIIAEEKLYFEEATDDRLSTVDVPTILLMYADCRVTPAGVTSYRERIDDLKKRYGGVASPTWYEWTFWFDEWMQKHCRIDLNSITEETVRPLFDELLTLTI